MPLLLLSVISGKDLNLAVRLPVCQESAVVAHSYLLLANLLVSESSLCTFFFFFFCHWRVILAPKVFKSSGHPEKMRQAGDRCIVNGWDMKHNRKRKMDVAIAVGIRRSEA